MLVLGLFFALILIVRGGGEEAYCVKYTASERNKCEDDEKCEWDNGCHKKEDNGWSDDDTSYCGGFVSRTLCTRNRRCMWDDGKCRKLVKDRRRKRVEKMERNREAEINRRRRKSNLRERRQRKRGDRRRR